MYMYDLTMAQYMYGFSEMRDKSSSLSSISSISNDLVLPICTALVVTAVFSLQWCLKKKPKAVLPTPYEALYTLDTRELPETAENVAHGRVEDETPQGRVAMTYAADQEAFLYWSDRSAVPYRYLDTVARKWVIVFDRRDVYVNIYREALQALQALQSTNDKKKKATKERVNKYFWRGRFAEAAAAPPPPKAKAANPIRYSDFKKL